MNQWYKVTITEGRNREVRRLWEAVGMQVSRLIRVRYGNIALPKWLPRGGWADLDLNAINYLRALVDLKLETVSKMLVKRERCHIKANQNHRAVKHSIQVTGRSCHRNASGSKSDKPSKRR